MYPFFAGIGSMKVSEALPLLEYISADYGLDLTVLPKLKLEKQKQPLVIWRNHAMTIARRILKNSQRNN